MKKYIFIAIAALSVASCKLDDNISQNDPGVEQVTPDLYLSAAQTSNYNVEVGDIFELSNVWMNNWSGNIYYFASPYSAEYQLQVTSAFARGNNFWNNSYTAMARYAAIYNNSQVDKYPHHAAIAKILMANSMQYIVDFYGDAPFSEAFKREANLTPKYDKGEDIYRNLVVMINEATQSIDNATPLFPVGTEDEVFAGDMEEWKKLANTIKLRILLRQSKVTDPTIKTFVQAQLQTLQGADFVSETMGDATINPGYNNSNATQQNPLIRNYASLNFDQSAENLNGYRAIDLSSHFAGLLNGTNAKTTGTTDARRGIMYRAVNGTLRGIVQGEGQVAGATEASFSRMAWKFREINTQGTAFVENSGIDGTIMSVAESELLQAEAAELYPAIFTNGIGHYNNAIRASFRFFAVPATVINPDPAGAYITSLSTKPYGWNGADGHIAAIQYQRMVALHYIKPQETYVNYLKTGYPITPLALTATQPNKPWRLVYPAREYNTNSANVPNVTQADVFVKNQFTPFWNRN
ncbi:SusD/RagB family nutrient-binding outer membrane lipoprotein [Chryseobacterium wangxinyae]|uniref:SusD/RagB family nutrient-binding outer membrane lipoprotein n=1 Tax=Chryseobacterium sp. CY353 TaxID=2997334 RepID=UPI00226F252A|nr:SusD/RagB family nutrient-binding outer membrane lipoprotein [Chryseobacterium sp. CY353]MCY0968811.1 SusD/RagB family nutrient-binding outer membrane lipoprotein [Chryseobacterium sp. CY353]